ncbi:MAG: histidine kinase, partial [Eubacteriales bacterium]|nr:histidine kinase [Eubacteriales bacterium]
GGLLDSDGELSDSDEELAETFWNLAAEMEAGASMSVQDGFVGGTLLTCREYETALGTLRIICAVPQFELIKDVMWLYVSIIILMVILAVLTFVFLKTYTRRLVVPIQDLKERMDQTGIQNLEELSGLTDDKNELEEITALKKGYNRLIARIKEGMLREKKLESLQVQANLDTLQAQINPHFINNTLSVISYRGTLLGDDEICEVCNSLSAMMKFSANTKKRIVTVREELDYVEAYMQLLKYRHQDKFEYRIQVEKELYPQRLPKVVIQQLVENSMSHGYRTPHEKMTVEVTGWVQDGWWYIQVCDNGDGFDESVLERLRTEMERVRREILDEHRIQEMEIGGMGIMNIYSRMLLLHSQNFRLEIENMEAGAKVVLCSVMEEELE